MRVRSMSKRRAQRISSTKASRSSSSGILVSGLRAISLFEELFYDRKVSSDFHVNARELEPLGVLSQDKSYKFKFKDFEKQYESYYGNQVKLTYFLRVTVGRSYSSKIQKKVEK